MFVFKLMHSFSISINNKTKLEHLHQLLRSWTKFLIIHDNNFTIEKIKSMKFIQCITSILLHYHGNDTNRYCYIICYHSIINADWGKKI